MGKLAEALEVTRELVVVVDKLEKVGKAGEVGG